jgi:hypothetical protein
MPSPSLLSCFLSCLPVADNVSSYGNNLSTSQTLCQGSGAMRGLDPWGPCLPNVATLVDDGMACIVL